MYRKKIIFDIRKSPYIFIAPFLIVFLVFWLWPIIQSFIWGFYEWDGIGKMIFVKFDNYINLFKDYDFTISLKNTFMAGAVYIFIMVIIAIILGFILNSNLLKGYYFFRTAFFIPVTVSLSVVALIFFIIYSPANGILNKILLSLGIGSPIDWLGNPKLALWSIVILRIWRVTGYYAIFILAGLQGISLETIEAGLIDGANKWQMTRFIILPQLKSVIVYVVLIASVAAFQLFEEPWILNQGGPINSTSTVGIFIYRNAFQYNRLGYACASSYLLTIIIIVFAIFHLRITKEQ